MKVKYNDGGRSKYYNASARDCVTRAVAIAAGVDYKEAYRAITKLIGYTPRNGVFNADVKKIMKHFGGQWTPCMTIGSGCKVHLADNEVPMQGRIVCNCSGHLVAVIDGVINDIYDPSRGGTRCVYGYWTF